MLGLSETEWLIAGWTIAVGALTSASCAVVGCYLVLRRMSMLGDAISHSVLPGLALAFLLSGVIGGWPALLGAMVLGVLTTILTEYLRDRGSLPEDSSMGVVFTSFFAIGVILITRAASDAHIDVDCVLYGLIEGVALDRVEIVGWEVPRTMLTAAPMLAVTVAFVALFWKELKIVSFDPALATAMGYRASIVHYLLMAIVAGVTVASFEAVGSILVIAMLIVPAATAHMLTDRLVRMIGIAVVVAVISSAGGYAWAFAWNTSVAGMMAVVAGIQFALAVLFSPRHGVLSKIIRNAALMFRIVAEDVLAYLYRQEEQGGNRIGEPLMHMAGTSAGMAWLARTWLQYRQWITKSTSGELVLTDAGRARAAKLVRFHRLWEAYMGENFDIPTDHLHAAAERMEHFIGPELSEELLNELAQSDRDPHGRPIPSEFEQSQTRDP